MATIVDGEGNETDSEEEQYLFNLSYLKIGNENQQSSTNTAISSTKDLLLKRSVVEGLTETQDLLNTPVAQEITEDFSPTCPAEFFYENELFRKKINDVNTAALKDFIQSAVAPVSKQLIDTDNSMINTQLTLQNVSTAMKNISQTSKKINNKFHSLMECKFLPKINNRQPE